MEPEPIPTAGNCTICQKIMRDLRNKRRQERNENRKTAREERRRKRQVAKEQKEIEKAFEQNTIAAKRAEEKLRAAANKERTT